MDLYSSPRIPKIPLDLKLMDEDVDIAFTFLFRECDSCGTREASAWRTGIVPGTILCNPCGLNKSALLDAQLDLDLWPSRDGMRRLYGSMAVDNDPTQTLARYFRDHNIRITENEIGPRCLNIWFIESQLDPDAMDAALDEYGYTNLAEAWALRDDTFVYRLMVSARRDQQYVPPRSESMRRDSGP